MNPIVRSLCRPALASVLLLLCVATAWAQSAADSARSCPVKLAAAQQLYESGRVAAALDTLNGCDLFHDRSKQQAYFRLIALCHLELGQREEAEAAMKALLRYFPLFVPSFSVDPMPFIELYRTFKATPRLVFALNAGPNLTDTRVLTNYTLSGSPQPGYYVKLVNAFNAELKAQQAADTTNDPDLKVATGMNADFLKDSVERYNGMLRNAGLNLTASFGVGISPVLTVMLHNTLSYVRYGYSSAIMQPAGPHEFNAFGELTLGDSEAALPLEDINPLYRYEFTQSLLSYQPTLALRFTWPRRFEFLPIRPYAEVLGGGSFRLSMSRWFETFITPEYYFAPTASPPEDFTTIREPEIFRRALMCWGGGAGVYIGRGTIQATAGISATKWVGNILNTNVSRYDHEFVSQLYHVDDDLTLTTLTLTGGVVFNFAYQVKGLHRHEK